MIADRYRLERKVGGGRVSAVWRVRDEVSARPCAIKILHRSMHKHPEALTRFSLEDRLARELNGPHFPERVGSGVWDGMRYIAWRWHEGESLRALFERTPKQDAPTVHSVVQETCQALALVHAAGYTHGDLKPENILFADRGQPLPDRGPGERSRQVKLLGFGVASRLSRPSAAGFGVGRRRPGEVVGTPLYLSPDLILGRVPNGGQADLWALAVIVYEALTGRPPFLGFDIGAVLQAILERRAPRPTSIAENLPASFDTWWAQALAQEFDTPGEFASALARALAPALRSSHTQRSASLPERLPPALEALTPMPSAPPRPSAPPAPRPSAPINTGTTATGIGPADFSSFMRPAGGAEPAAAEPPRASDVQRAAEPLRASVEASPRPSAEPASGAGDAAPVDAPATEAPRPAEATHAEPPADAAVGSGTESFAPLPSPLRDLAAEGSKKTLVGITPPSHLKSGAPIAAAAAPAKAARRSTADTIEGAPCKPIETNERSPFDAALFDLRRPANPTVPFPRPRVSPRHGGGSNIGVGSNGTHDDALSAGPGMEETPDIGRGWHGTTTRTLRVALTSPDHKPQRVAAALVCAAAALVIFALGRSPIAGTAAIGQATEALTAEPVQDPQTPSIPADPSPRSELAAASGSDDASELPTLPAGGRSHEPAPLEADELAPGLIATPRDPSGSTRPASDTSASDASPSGALDTGSAAKPGRSAAVPPAKTSIKKPPPPPASLPTPPARNKSTELDFGI